MGRTHANTIKRFREMNPEYSFEFFGSDAVDDYMKKYYGGQRIYDVFSNLQAGPAKADVWRYCMLYERGGFYFDINKMVEVPLKNLITKKSDALISFESHSCPANLYGKAKALLAYPNTVINWGLAFVPGHPFLKRVIDNIEIDYAKHKGVVCPRMKDAVLEFTGPIMLTRSIIEVLEQEPRVSCDVAGIDFNGSANYRIRRSWVRYLQKPRYQAQRNCVMVR